MPPHAKESSPLVVTTNNKAEMNNNKFSRVSYPLITNYLAHQARHNSNNNGITKKRTIWSSSSSSSTAPTTAKKSVHFNESVRCQKVLHLAEYTKEERADSWYTSHQMSNMKQAVKDDSMTLEVLGMRKCRQMNVEEFCVRGLEHRTRDAAQARFQNRCLALHVVLDEQQRQDDFGIYDPEQLARCYRSETSHCQVMAYEIGMDDEYSCVTVDE
jgi:hypothetical protein